MRINTIPPFVREAKPLLKKYVSLRDELKELISQLATNPIQGTSIGRGCYKIRLRIASKGKGSSGGARVITCVVAVEETVYLLSIYDKSEQDSISDARLQQLLQLLPPVK
ncbi:MAG: type II toxin-antitoxin system RelE/ParE family toxin [Hymenobacter sp.]|nr:type II toxin-antitoxin system RelE/ParE family toxin [Hymenobacter sp.]